MPKKSIKKPIVEEETYVVEVILGARVVEPSSDEDSDPQQSSAKKKKTKRKKNLKKPKWEYHVKWEGYESEYNTWEPERNLFGCQHILTKFWEHVGIDDEDYLVGHEVRASDAWIRKQKIGQEKPEKKKSKKKSISQISTTSASREPSSVPQASASKNTINVSSDSDSDGSRPLASTLGKKRKRPPRVISDDEDDSQLGKGSSQPPAKLQKLNVSMDQNDQLVNVERQVSPSPASPSSLFSAPSSPDTPFSSKPLPRAPSPARVNPVIPRKVPAPLPKIQRRPMNPHTKILDMPSAATTSTGISTKQRLAQGALEPILPNAQKFPSSRPKAGPSAVARTPSSTLSSLSFKKTQGNTAEADRNLVVNFSTDLKDLPAQVARSETATGGSFSFGMPSGLLPSNITPQGSIKPSEQTIVQAPPAFKASSIAPIKTTPHLNISQTSPNVETFEHRDDFVSLASPVIPRTIDPRLSLRQPSLVQTRTPKKTSWSGPLFIREDEKDPELVCQVMFEDITEPKETGISFSAMLETVAQIELCGFHDTADLAPLLSACKHPGQFAQVAPLNKQPNDSFETLLKYITKNQKIVFVPCKYDDETSGHILLFSGLTDLSRSLKVPLDAQNKCVMVATLLLWSLPSSLMSRSFYEAYSNLECDSYRTPILNEKRWARSIRIKSTYHHALRILQFPQDLHQYLSMSAEGRDRSFCVWWYGGDGTKAKPGVETMMLCSIMEQCRPRKLRHNERELEVRVVFVHIGALRTLPKLSMLMERRQIAKIRFYTYGTHENVPPKFWGIKEIYPCGGVITFTPNAFLENPLEIMKQIKRIKLHPLWTCYILPSVLGFTSSIACNEDPLTAFEDGNYPFSYLLSAIERGEVALIEAPRGFSPHTVKDWTLNYIACIPQSSKDSLIRGISAFKGKFSNIPGNQWQSMIEKDILADMVSMQTQPEIIAHYRRFVIFKGEQDFHNSEATKGFECVSASKFDFRDDFFISK